METIILSAESESWLYSEVVDLFTRAREAGLECRITDNVIRLEEDDKLTISYEVKLELNEK